MKVKTESSLTETGLDRYSGSTKVSPQKKAKYSGFYKSQLQNRARYSGFYKSQPQNRARYSDSTNDSHITRLETMVLLNAAT